MAQQMTPEQLKEQILQRLKENTTGVGGVGAITQAKKEFADIEGKVKSGELDQDSYIGIANAIKDYVTPIGAISTTGSKGATAATQAGWYDVQANFRNADIYKSAKELMGRDITSTEFAQIAPRFGTGSAKDIETGRAYLAELAGQEAKSPTALAKKAPEYSGQVNETFQGLLGRDASSSEADYYGRLLATGEITPYEIEQYVKSGKEFQSGEDKKFRGELAGELGGYRDEAFDKAQESILSRQARMTGPHKSSNLDFALAGAAENLQGETERYLTGISASQYGGNKDNARADYQQMLQQYLAGQDYSTRRSDSYVDYLTQRADQSVDYTQQMTDYLKYLNSQPKQKGNKMQGALAGAGSMAATGNPYLIGGAAGLGYLLS